jgi:protocatechuate 3,4-dioxygenase beta subunit
MLKPILSLLIIACLFINPACKKANSNIGKADTSTNLQIKVLDDAGNPAAGAQIDLHITKAGFLGAYQDTPLGDITDANGIATFYNVNPRVYYFYILRNTSIALI